MGKKDSAIVEKLNAYLNTDKIYTILKICCFGLLIFQVLGIVYINLFQNQNHLGYDSSVYYLKAIEMWKQKSLFLNNWVEQTSLMLDTPIPLAALLYGITGNIFVSYGISNILTMAAIIAVAYSILKDFGFSNLSKLLFLNLLLTPFITGYFNNVNNINYFAAIFVSSGFYSVKFLLSLLIFKTMTILLHSEINMKRTIFIIIVTCLTFISGVSCGYYIVVFSLLPCLLFLVVRAIIKNDLKYLFNKALVWAVGSCLLVFLGKLFATRVIGFYSIDSNRVLTGLEDFVDNLFSIYLGFAELMGVAHYYSDVGIFTKTGIVYLINWSIHLMFLAAVIYSAKLLFRKKAAELQDRTTLLLCTLVLNFMLFIFSFTTYGSMIFEVRYLIPVYFFLLFGVPFFFDRTDSKKFLKKFIVTALFIVLAMTNLYSHLYYNKVVIDSDIKKIPEEIAEYDAEVVFGYGNNDVEIGTRNLRALDTDHIYKLITATGAHHWGDYTYYDDAGEHQKKTIMFTTESDFETLPEYIQNKYTYQKSVGEYAIYLSQNNYIDLKTELPDQGMAMDYPYSPGILTDHGTIRNDGGFYNIASGTVLWGSNIGAKEGKFKVILNYEVVNEGSSNKIGLFSITTNNGQNVIAEGELTKDSKQVTLEEVVFDDLNENFEIKVSVDGSARIRIDNIIYEKVQ